MDQVADRMISDAVEPKTRDVCPECGAPQIDGITCQARLKGLLAVRCHSRSGEYSLAIACYALQHPAHQSRRALAWAWFQIVEATRGTGTPDEVRERARRAYDTWRGHVPRRVSAQGLAGRPWRMHIGDLPTIVAHSDAERFLRWAQTIHMDIIQKGDTHPD